MISAPLTTFPIAALVFAGGAAAGRGLAALAGQLAQAEGDPSSRYYALADGARFADIPILGYFLRSPGSRCRRGLALECGGACSLLLCWALFSPAKAACGAVFLLALLGASCIDFDHMIIPDLFTVGLGMLGLALSALVPALHGLAPWTLVNCLRSAAAGALGLAIGSAFVLWFSLIAEMILGREVLGFGDVKFLGAIGAFCGWQGAVFSVFGGAAIGALVLGFAFVQRTFRGESALQLFRSPGSTRATGRLAWGAHFPFGPMLAAAAALYFLVLHPVVDRYLAQYLILF
jgi:leader peptidase (prepilin peptidase)/N-methyltransferase